MEIREDDEVRHTAEPPSNPGRRQRPLRDGRHARSRKEVIALDEPLPGHEPLPSTLPHLAFKRREVTHQLLTGPSRDLLSRGSSTTAATERSSLSARRGSERASRSSAVTALKDGRPALSPSAMALILRLNTTETPPHSDGLDRARTRDKI